MFCPGAEAVHETSETPTRGFRREFNELLPCLKFGDEILVKPLAVATVMQGSLLSDKTAIMAGMKAG